ncbi:hypothetical protein Sjap_009383 [Stephania japonica]|uniref:Uncharacterized protein n=1 Tax=Stephania japonica TaxID=461633 RepID=A0AAP0PD92_9MAGN
MAAEAILPIIVERFSSMLIQEASILRGVHTEVKWIEGELKEMQSFIRDSDGEQAKDPALNKWVSSIREIACDAEDILETFILKKARQRRRKFLKRYIYIISDLKLRYKIGKDIKLIKDRLHGISEDRPYYRSHNEGRGQEVLPRLHEQRQSSPLLGDIDIVGLEKDVAVMESRLSSGDQGLEVISIVGMGGLGKTTLAKIVYNGDVAKSHFAFRAWVCVSQHYNTRELLIEIEKQALVRSGEEMREAFVEERVYHFLSKQRYLIVMDDVWSTHVWDSLHASFPDKRNGSRIIFTTRNKKIAVHADQSSPPHQLQVLNHHNSWKLFLIKLFGSRNNCPSNLEELGGKMVRRCEGLPLAIVLLRGLLSTKELSVDAWSGVANGLNWHVEESLTWCDAILALSYEDLPFYLKQCFMYFGLFPEGFEISKKRLIRMWIAEGFLFPKAKEAPEDVGKEYIEELAARNIIQVANSDGDGVHNFLPSTTSNEGNLNQFGKNETCRMHDRIRELALSKAKDANFLHVHEVDEASFLDLNTSNGEINFLQYPGTESSLQRTDMVRRLAVHFGTEISRFFPMRSFSFSLESLVPRHSIKHLRSLLYFDLREGEIPGQEMRKFLYRGISSRKLELVRVLDLEGIYKPKLPNALGKLIHLRYLGLRRTWLDTLPPSIGNLFNLQTLDLKYTEIKTIPSSIWRMQQLRHLFLDWQHNRIWDRPRGYCCSRNLRTLWGVCVGEDNIVRDGLNQLSNLRKLGMEGDLISQGDALAEWISQLGCLASLKLRSTTRTEAAPELPSSSTAIEHSHSHVIPSSMTFSRQRHLSKIHLEGRLEKLFDKHEFPPHLTTLTLVQTQLRDDPMKILQELPSLRILKLWRNSYKGTRLVCSSSGFHKLEVLELRCLEMLQEFVLNEGAMPNLAEMEINKCEQLRMIPDGLQHLNNLKELRLPALSEELSTRILSDKGHDWYKIRHVPFVVRSIRKYSTGTSSTSMSNQSPDLAKCLKRET